MTQVRISAPRLRVYTMLVDGGKDGRPLCPASIIKELGKGHSTIYDHVAALEREKYIRPIRGTSSPTLYERGDNSPILDELLKARDSGVSGVPPDGGRDAHYCSPENNNAPETVHIPTGEAHVNGRYIFPVLHEGGHHIMLPDDGGEKRDVVIFGPDPVNLNSGVRYYKGRVPLGDGTALKVHYYDQGTPALHVWPDPVATVASTVATAPDRLQERAAEATAIMSKYGGWRFGDPEFRGEGIHYATNDPAIMGNFPEDFVPASDSGYWRDHTPPPDSVETKSKERAQAVLDFHGATRELRAGQKSLDLRIVELRHQLEGLVSISEMVAVSIANIAAAEAEQIERAARGMADRMDAEVMSS